MEDQGNKFGNIPRSDSSQPQKSNSFIRDGIEIFNYKNPATIVTFGLVAFVFFIISITLVVDRRGRTEIEKIVIQTVLNVKVNDQGTTIGGKFKELDETNIHTKNEIGKLMELKGDVDILRQQYESPNQPVFKTKGKK